MSKYTELKKITVSHFRQMKDDGVRIATLTAYDYTSARILDNAGIDLILVGDSLGMVMNGNESTLPVTVDEIIYHTKSVRKGAKRAFLVADLPFGSYQASMDDAIANSIRIIKESGAEAVKLEGGREFAPLVKRLVSAGIPVMGHIGLMPQSVNTMGGFKVQGKLGGDELLKDAQALEEAGAFSIVLEGVVADVAASITSALSIPTIGIGAGVGCDGQILVYHDVFGLFDDFTPKFVKKYCSAAEMISGAAKEYIDEVRGGVFPTDAHSFHRQRPQVADHSERSAVPNGSAERSKA